MNNINTIFQNNLAWAKKTAEADPNFFNDLAAVQTPKYLWIGCSDSRVPANEITGLKPGEIFVHRNIANIVVHSDFNCLSVIQYAINVLKVEHILVVGHYGCGGVEAALEGKSIGLVDNWLRHIQDVRDRHDIIMNPEIDRTARLNLLCELNIIDQVRNVARTTIIYHAWRCEQNVTLHGLIYGLKNGVLHDLEISIDNLLDIESTVNLAIDKAIARVSISK